MGEAKRKRTATQKLVEEYPECCECGGLRQSTTREHMPPKALFDGSLRPDKLVMPACETCNDGTRTADLTASIVSRWGYGPQLNGDHSRLANRVRKQAPKLVDEWTTPINEVEARRHLKAHGVPVPEVAAFLTVGPHTIRQLNLFAYKVVLCLHFEHFKRSLSNDGRVAAFWRSKEDFAKEGIPKDLLEMMHHYGTLEQGKWSVREAFEYRYSLNEQDGLFACLARFRENLFVSGFTAPLEATKRVGFDEAWIRPCDLLDAVNTDAFARKH